MVFKPPARLVLRAAPTATRLRFGLAVRPPTGSLRLRVLVDGAQAHEEGWSGERSWVERAVDLGAPSRRPKEVAVQIDGDAETAFLGHPQTLAAASGAAARRPNVIVYVVDCLRADHVGAFGYKLPTTPSLDALATDGVVLADLNSCAAWTKPSTACLFTSLLPTDHRARTVDDALVRERTTLAERFQAAGYRTLAWVANPVIDPALFLFNQGFDRWVDLRSLRERSGATHVNSLEPDAAEITRAVLPWLRAHRDESFFLYLHSLDLHFGYRPRPPFDQAFVTPESTGLERERQLYDNEIAYNDREVGRLVAALKQLGLYDDTVVFVTSDHGEEFGEHGIHAPREDPVPGAAAHPRDPEAPALRPRRPAGGRGGEQHRRGPHAARARGRGDPRGLPGSKPRSLDPRRHGRLPAARLRRGGGPALRRVQRARRALQVRPDPRPLRGGDAVRPRGETVGDAQPGGRASVASAGPRLRAGALPDARPARLPPRAARPAARRARSGRGNGRRRLRRGLPLRHRDRRRHGDAPRTGAASPSSSPPTAARGTWCCRRSPKALP